MNIRFTDFLLLVVLAVVLYFGVIEPKADPAPVIIQQPAPVVVQQPAPQQYVQPVIVQPEPTLWLAPTLAPSPTVDTNPFDSITPDAGTSSHFDGVTAEAGTNP